MTIKELRDKLGWSREKLASEIGVSFFTVQKWELGLNKPSPMAQRLIDALLREGKGEGKC
jgi:putative transcriptional regulator